VGRGVESTSHSTRFSLTNMTNKFLSFSAQKIPSLHSRRPWVNIISCRQDFVLEHDGVRLVFDFVIVSVALKSAMLYITILQTL
jgi:hypothetical protein